MDIKATLYEIDSELRLAFVQIDESESPECMTETFISMCKILRTVNQIIETAPHGLAELFYGCNEPNYHPLIEQLYLDYFASLNSEVIDQYYVDSEFNPCLL